MRVTITGGAGRIARFTAARLAAEGHEVTLFDRVVPELAGADDPRRGLAVVTGDIMEPVDCARACAGAEGVVHLAGILVPTPDTFSVNTVGTWNVLEAARSAGVRRVVLASSINAYGIGWHITPGPLELVERLPLTEDQAVHPEDSYSLSKYFNEVTAAAFTRAYGMETAALRFSGVWLPERTETYAANLPEPSFGPGPSGYTGIWSYVDIRDVAQGVCKALLAPGLPVSGAYVIAAEDTTAALPTMELLRRFLPAWVPKAEGIAGRQSLYSSARAAAAFGYRPEYSWTRYIRAGRLPAR